MSYLIGQGHVLDLLARFPDNSVNLAVTSPPYYSLRAYGTEPMVWGGNDPGCPHNETAPAAARPMTGGCGPASAKQVTNTGSQVWNVEHRTMEQGNKRKPSDDGIAGRNRANDKGAPSLYTVSGAICRLCGAWKGELGSEPTVDLFIEHLLMVFKEVQRVLTPDGLFFLNVADNYSASGKGPTGHNGLGNQGQRQGFTDDSQRRGVGSGVPPKSLMLVPERLSIGLLEQGWTIRSRVAWCKKAPMPESVTDRYTSAWEFVYVLSKSRLHYWDREAVLETAASRPSDWEHVPESKEFNTGVDMTGGAAVTSNPQTSNGLHRQSGGVYGKGGRNPRNFWLLSPDPFTAMFCTACRAYFDGSDKKRITVVRDDRNKIVARVCPCGRSDAWFSHYAVFPREIPRRAIRAATSEKGRCGQCGKPWVRITERATPPHVDPSEIDRFGTGDHGVHRKVGSQYQKWLDANPKVTVGWKPSCGHSPDIPPVPDLVLDPFSGAGTVGVACVELGRRYIGLELNRDYVEMSRHRIARTAPAPKGVDPAVLHSP